MTTVESPRVTVGTTSEALRDHFAIPANLESFLPADKVSAFESTADGCSFKLPGGIHIVLGLDPAPEADVIRYASRKGTPIRFHLDLNFRAHGEHTEGQIVCEADLNPFTRMMAEKPLQELFNHIAGELRERYPV